MKTTITADLYIRVSTDEQTHGYSQRHQEDVLQKYCALNNVQVRKVIYEDHSAKNFNRPEWNAMLNEYKKKKGIVDVVYFLKWDRFSRNAGDAYAMISTLRKLGIEPQAVEQPLDMEIPESKIMLAFYLAAPEVENDRRSLNVSSGMRRAKKEGRFMGVAPIGYANKSTEDGKKYIAPKEPEASIIKFAFNELAKGQYSIEQIWKLVKGKGLNCSKNNFWHLIKNPVYCGKIFVSRYRNEDEQLVQGLHEPLISESLFYDAQDVLNGKKRNLGTKVVSLDNLPLRGFLNCPSCGKTLTGSPSKGRNRYYYYYHCTTACGSRYKAELANDAFERKLAQYNPKPGMVELYQQVIASVYKKQYALKQDNRKELLTQIAEQNTRLSKARELLLTEAIDASDYRTIKKETETALQSLEAKLYNTTSKSIDIEGLLQKASQNIQNLSHIYVSAPLSKKRNLIGSIFPEKWVFDGELHRTTKINEAIRLIYSLDKFLGENKNGTNAEKLHLSHEVIWIGFEPMTLSLEG
jgi:site-specific DNA recombinase